MSKTSEQIDYIIKVGLHPVIKREGFRKSSRTFRRPCTRCVQIINVQGSWTNYDDIRYREKYRTGQQSFLCCLKIEILPNYIIQKQL